MPLFGKGVAMQVYSPEGVIFEGTDDECHALIQGFRYSTRPPLPGAAPVGGEPVPVAIAPEPVATPVEPQPGIQGADVA